jgi:hypothetical protein
MPIILRMHTFRNLADSWLDEKYEPKAPFREYNAEAWEPWMRYSYSPAARPFTDGPESRFAHNLDPHITAAREGVVQDVMGFLNRSTSREGNVKTQKRFWRWRKLSKREKEDVLLQIWAREHRLCEQHRLAMMRSEALECTLESLVGSDGSGKGMEELVLAVRTEPDFDISTSPVPTYHHDAWDRMWSVWQVRACRAILSGETSVDTILSGNEGILPD